MTIRKDSLSIKEPCNESWQAMDGDASRRFCGSCTKHVHNLSEMTEAEARKLLREESGLCVRYRYGDDGVIRFADSNVASVQEERVGPGFTVPVSRDEQLLRQRGGVARLSLVASTLLAAGLMAACDASATERTRSEPPAATMEESGDLVTQRSGSDNEDFSVEVMGGLRPEPPVVYETMGEPVPPEYQHQYPDRYPDAEEPGEGGDQGGKVEQPEATHEVIGDVEYVPETGK